MNSGTGDLPHDLAAVLRELVLLTRRATAHMAVSSQQLGVLGSLAGGPRRVSALAEEHGVRTPTMTGMLTRLEQAGAVLRRPDAEDARAVAVELTGHGRELLARGRAAREEFLARCLDEVDEADREAVRAALPALARLCARAPQER
ncbi:MarR family winged helix-turn-helix transcriptional regulator [Nocardiopsis potens]|uniref:MarR family winged helix-turn-helix transcriptional regulator n=1 Tax=Nocardiopsis potens TaxID=1246458 RepID=UPI00034BC911|nr:MarR family transcriptional regulator [Nocardiopsis potens]